MNEVNKMESKYLGKEYLEEKYREKILEYILKCRREVMEDPSNKFFPLEEGLYLELKNNHHNVCGITFTIALDWILENCDEEVYLTAQTICEGIPGCSGIPDRHGRRHYQLFTFDPRISKDSDPWRNSTYEIVGMSKDLITKRQDTGWGRRVVVDDSFVYRRHTPISERKIEDLTAPHWRDTIVYKLK